ncbi:MAG TPA: hypothetical protein VL475_13825 [Planctomycetaceae bacterium]|nr:hypothetical protein [Planctomycetaceae bacterium]
MVAEKSRFQTSPQKTAESCSMEWVVEHALTSVSGLFGLGIAVGMRLGPTIAESTGHKLFHEDSLTEKLTAQIRDAVRSTLPQGLSRHLS